MPLPVFDMKQGSKYLSTNLYLFLQAPLTIREEHQRFLISDLSKHDVEDVGSAIDYLHEGNRRRSTASTCQNETSSRSHALFSIYLKRFVSDSSNEKQGLVNFSKQASVRKYW